MARLFCVVHPAHDPGDDLAGPRLPRVCPLRERLHRHLRPDQQLQQQPEHQQRRPFIVLLWITFWVALYVGLIGRRNRKQWWNGTVQRMWNEAYYYVPSIDEMIQRYSVQLGRTLSSDEINVLGIKHQEFVYRRDAATAQQHNEQMGTLNAIALLEMVNL